MFFVAKGKVMITTANVRCVAVMLVLPLQLLYYEQNKQFTLPSGIALGEIALMRPMSKRTAVRSPTWHHSVY
jgi:hypothetical protein